MKTTTNKPLYTRAPGVVQTSITLPQEMMDTLTKLSKTDYRSRNSLINLLLHEALATYSTRDPQKTG